MHLDLGEQRLQVLASEFPLERVSNGTVVILEAQQAILEFSQGAKVVGRERLALNDREVHLDLIERTDVHGRMHGDGRGPASLQAPDADFSAVREAVVHDPKHP